MPLLELMPNEFRSISTTTFAAAGIKERDDLQRLFRDQIELIDKELMVLAEEFSDWSDSNRRIDLLAMDRQANLVVIELKRTGDGGHMELQAIRYAAMVSTMTFRQAVDAHAEYLRRRGRDANAEAEILEHLDAGEADEEAFNQDVRVVLVSADFSREVTSAVLWLNDRGIDIRCIRLLLYADGTRRLLDVQQVLPLPEAGDYLVRMKQKTVQAKTDRQANTEREERRRRYWTAVIGKCRGRTPFHADMTPGPYHYIGTSAGVPGLLLAYVVRKHDANVELYIDLGKGFEGENKLIFEALRNQRGAIEEEFGATLEWQRLDGKRACRIRSVPGGSGWADDPDGWPAFHDELIGCQIQFEKALRPYLSKLKF